MIKAGGHDDGPDLDIEQLVFLIEIYGPRGAEFFAHAALAPLEPDAVFAVDDGHIGHGLGKGGIDGFSPAHAHVELGGHALGAFLLAHPATGAGLKIHIAGLLPQPGAKVAGLAGHRINLGVGHQLDLGMPRDIHHLGRHDAGGAIQCGEGLVQLRHPPADTGFPLYQIDLEPGIGDIQRGLHAGDARADDQRCRGLCVAHG